MYNPLSAEDVTFTNKSFWYYFLAAGHSRAFDPATGETFLTVMKRSGYAPDRYYVAEYLLVPVTEELRLTVEFNPNDIAFYLNDWNIGYTGSQYCLNYLSWTELQALSRTKPFGDQLFQLLLPVTVLEKHEAQAAEKEIAAHLLGLPLNPAHCDYFAGCIRSSLEAFDGILEELSGVGLICKDDDSLRNYHKYPDTPEGQHYREQLTAINQLLQKL